MEMNELAPVIFLAIGIVFRVGLILVETGAV